MWTAICAVVIPILMTIPLYMIWEWDWKYDLSKFGKYWLSSIVGCSLLSLCIHGCGTYMHSSFNECWNYKIVKVQYYEDWDEMVSCRHPVYCETRDSKGNTYRYICGYQHAFDVDYHPEEWHAVDEYGTHHGIDRNTYDIWRKRWKTDHFIRLNRRYYSNDGDMYEAGWTNKYDDIFPWSEIKQYENRVRVSKSVYSYTPVDKETQKKFTRPVDNNDTSPLQAYGVPKYNHDEWALRLVNAENGPSKKVHTLVILFDASVYGMDTIETLKAAWQGPNKNELVICVGVVPSTYEVKWCDVFSWMDDTTIHAKIRQNIQASPNLNIQDLSKYLRSAIPQYWEKKNFHDFDYLSITLPWGYKVAMFIVSIGLCISAGIVIENNS